MTIRQMGVGRGVSVGDGGGGRGDIGVFLSLVWTPPDPDTLCGPWWIHTVSAMRGG